MRCVSLWLLLTVLATAAAPGIAWAADGQSSETNALAEAAPEAPEPIEGDETTVSDAAPVTIEELNVLGRAKTGQGESRRNENVQFNLIDNNAFKEAAIRLGTNATLVREFDAEKNYFGSEYGGAPQGVLVLAPQAGRALHGAVRWMHLNSVTSARSFFQAGPVQAARENDYGFDATTGLWRGAALTVRGGQQKIRGNVNGNVLVPRADERTPLTTNPLERLFVQRMLDVYPDDLPNRTDIDPRALNTNAPQTINDSNATVRLDQAWSEKNRLGLDYAFFVQDLKAFQLIAAQNPDTTTRSHKAKIGYSRVLGPERVLDMTVGFDRATSLIVPEERSIGPAIFVSQALSPFGNGSTIPIDRAQNTFRYAGLYRWRSGNHQITVGAETQRRQVNGSEADSHRGVYSFGAAFGNDVVTNFRLGRATNYFRSIGDTHRGFRDWDSVYFIGDRWRAGSRLEINLGLRHRMTARPVEVNGLNVVPYSCDCNNVGPTFGFAYRTPGRTGVVRGAFGIHYGAIFPVTYQVLRFNAPGSTKLIIQEPDLLNPLRAIDPNRLEGVPGVVYMLSPDLVSPYSMQYNMSWEREVTPGWTLILGYLGSRSPKLLAQQYLNRAELVEGIEPTLQNINQRRPNPDNSDERLIWNASRGYFDAAKIRINAPSWRGMSLDAAYWFSKMMDLGADYTNTAANEDAFRTRSQSVRDVHDDMKALSRFDQPHAGLMRISYETPRAAALGRVGKALGGWQISSVTLFKSGTPFTLETGSDAPGVGNVDGVSGERPHILDPSILGRTIGHPDVSQQRMPREAFAFIDPGGAGTLGRFTFRKGPIRNVNASLSRRWAVGSEAWMVFRAESVNFLNTPQFAEPGSRLADSNFGAITNTLNEGRTFRLGIEAGF
jgi:hypothetical protein